MVVAVLIVYLQNIPLIASVALIVSSAVVIIFLLVVRPYESGVANTQAIINELSLIMFVMLVFKSSLMHGNILIAFLIIVMLTNAAVMVGTFLK